MPKGWQHCRLTHTHTRAQAQPAHSHSFHFTQRESKSKTKIFASLRSVQCTCVSVCVARCVRVCVCVRVNSAFDRRRQCCSLTFPKCCCCCHERSETRTESECGERSAACARRKLWAHCKLLPLPLPLLAVSAVSLRYAASLLLLFVAYAFVSYFGKSFLGH